MSALFAALDHDAGRNFDGSKNGKMFGFCFGAWVVAKCLADQETTKSKLLKDVNTSVSFHPSIHLEEGIYAGDVIKLCESIKSKMLLLPARNDSDRYFEGGDILRALQRANPSTKCDHSVGATENHGWVTRGDACNETTAACVTAALVAAEAFIA